MLRKGMRVIMEEDISKFVNVENLPEHIAIIMDGNRRWAKENNLDTASGHKEGAENLKRIAKFANKIGIKYLTVYAFSTENWKRTKEEVGAIMKLLKFYILDFFKSYDNNIKVRVIGRTDDLPKDIYSEIKKVEEKTKNNTGLVLNIAFNYGGRDEITTATKKIAEKVKNGELNIEDITEELISNNLYTAGQPDPDLLIRTSGEERISNFLTWQISYSEFVFTDKYWPAFSNQDLLETIAIYQKRTRRFGGNK
jgi:di-trans,poly-cis-decaprenylcistransferase